MNKLFVNKKKHKTVSLKVEFKNLPIKKEKKSKINFLNKKKYKINYKKNHKEVVRLILMINFRVFFLFLLKTIIITIKSTTTTPTSPAV